MKVIKEIFTENKKAFFFIVFLVTITLFVFLEPKVSARLFPFIRSSHLNSFLTHTVPSKKIDGRTYWEFREFYSPGVFTYDKKGIEDTIVKTVFRNDIQSKDQDMLPFLFFTSPFLQSIDSLTSETSITSFIVSNAKGNLINTPVLFMNRNDTEILLVFLLPYAAMERTNGFFDYQEKDKMLVKDKNWLNITRITIN